MKRYDGLFILDSVGHEDSVRRMVNGVKDSITRAGGKVASVDPMETRSFARVANRKIKSGFYFSILFDISAEGLAQVRESLREDVRMFRSSICRVGSRPPFRPAEPSAD